MLNNGSKIINERTIFNLEGAIHARYLAHSIRLVVAPGRQVSSYSLEYDGMAFVQRQIAHDIKVIFACRAGTYRRNEGGDVFSRLLKNHVDEAARFETSHPVLVVFCCAVTFGSGFFRREGVPEHPFVFEAGKRYDDILALVKV